MSAGTEFHCLLSVLDPVRDGYKSRDAEIAGHVEHPKAPPGFGQLGSEIAHIGIVELSEVQLRPLQPIVPPDCVRIPLDQFEKTLNDRLLQCIAGCAAVRVRVEMVRAG